MSPVAPENFLDLCMMAAKSTSNSEYVAELNLGVIDEQPGLPLPLVLLLEFMFQCAVRSAYVAAPLQGRNQRYVPSSFRKLSFQDLQMYPCQGKTTLTGAGHGFFIADCTVFQNKKLIATCQLTVGIINSNMKG